MSLRRPLRRIIALATVATATIFALAMLPSTLAAQHNNPNTTGLPMYPKLTTGSEYPSLKTDEGTFRIYTAQSVDELSVVEDWYRHTLKSPVEAKDDSKVTHGIKLTVGKDRVLVYQLGKSKGSVVELQKYLGP
jgi:hypothetical protein